MALPPPESLSDAPAAGKMAKPERFHRDGTREAQWHFNVMAGPGAASPDHDPGALHRGKMLA